MNEYEPLLEIHVEENPPVPDAAPPRRRLGLEPDDVAAEGVAFHRVERRQHAAPTRGGQPLKRLSCGSGEEQLPRSSRISASVT